MNQNFYNSPNLTFPGPMSQSNSSPISNQGFHVPESAPFPHQPSFIESVLKLNRGKRVDVFMTFPNSNDWRDRSFHGILESSGPDHLILSDPSSGEWHLLPIVYLNFIKFHERINYPGEFVPNN